MSLDRAIAGGEITFQGRAGAGFAPDFDRARTGLCPNRRTLGGVRSKLLQPPTDLPPRARLLRELDRDGASGEFLRQYLLFRRELSTDDLKALWDAMVGRTHFALQLAN